MKTHQPKGSYTEPKYNYSTQTNNEYCLVCRKPSCSEPNHEEYRFEYSYKLRVPLNWKKRAVFRKFLDDCPNFVNLVSVEQKDKLIKLLKDIRYFEKSTKGPEWAEWLSKWV